MQKKISPDDFSRLLDPNTFEALSNSVKEDPLRAPFPKNIQKIINNFSKFKQIFLSLIKQTSYQKVSGIYSQQCHVLIKL